MLTGRVNDRLDAVIRLHVIGINSTAIELDTILDTGFTGYLTLPPAVISHLRLEFEGREEIEFADGRIDLCDSYSGFVEWGNELREVIIESAATDPLIGMSLMRGHDLHIRVTPGGVVRLELF